MLYPPFNQWPRSISAQRREQKGEKRTWPGLPQIGQAEAVTALSAADDIEALPSSHLELHPAGAPPLQSAAHIFAIPIKPRDDAFGRRRHDLGSGICGCLPLYPAQKLHRQAIS